MPLPETYQHVSCCQITKDSRPERLVAATPEKSFSRSYTPPRIPSDLGRGLSERPVISVSLKDILVKDGIGETFCDLNGWITQKLENERIALVARVKAELSQQLPKHSDASLVDLKRAFADVPQLREPKLATPSVESEANSSLDREPVGAFSAKSSANTRPKDDALKSRPSSLSKELTPRGIAQRRKEVEQSLRKLFPGNSELLGEDSTLLQRIVLSSWFECASVVVILLNTMVMSLEIQYNGINTGSELNYVGFSETGKEKYPYAEGFFLFMSVLCNSIFVVELCLRIAVMGRLALCSSWIWLDFFLVGFGLLDLLTELKLLGGIGFDPSMLRVARLARLMRLVKTLKGGKSNFHSLFLLMKSINASFTALFWSILLLLALMMSAGMVVNQFMASFFDDLDNELEHRRIVFSYFGTFTKTMLTMFEITLGNWAPPARALMDYVDEFWAVLIVIYRNVICFAVINVIRAVFIMETTRVASSDDEVALLNNDRADKALESKLHGLFTLMDSSGNGELSRDEFLDSIRDPKVAKYMGTLDLDGHSLINLYDLLAEQEEPYDVVYVEEFKRAIATMRGSAKAIDLWFVIKVLRDVHELIGEKFQKSAKHVQHDHGLPGQPCD